jgi:hypothetical protein
MEDLILLAMFEELDRAREKYPDDQWPWYGGINTTPDKAGAWSILEAVALVDCESGEALNAANKLYFNDSGSVSEVKKELLQVMATAYRLLRKLGYEN